MTEELDAKTFDLADMLAGRTYPETTVEVYLDEKAAYLIYSLHEEIKKAEFRGDDSEELERDLKQARDLAESSRLTFHLKGVSQRELDNVSDSISAKFPVEYDFLNRPKPNPEAEREHLAALWAIHVQKIERPDGSLIAAPGAEQMRIFRSEAPSYAVKAVEKAIGSLASGAAKGFEEMAQDHDFLSQR